MEEIIKLNANPEFREFMTYEMDQKIIHNTELAEAKKEAIKQGIDQGIKQGIKQGSKERNIQIAKNMIKESIDVDTIIKCTNLTKEEIEELK